MGLELSHDETGKGIEDRWIVQSGLEGSCSDPEVLRAQERQDPCPHQPA